MKKKKQKKRGHGKLIVTNKKIVQVTFTYSNGGSTSILSVRCNENPGEPSSTDSTP
jgi:hypothetical protein